MINIKCHNCKEKLEALEELRGEYITCPKCDSSVEVVGDNLDLLKPLGNIDAVCPSCNGRLDEFPKRKKKCPNCGEYIYVRTRPRDKNKVLVTYDESEEIKKQYFVGYGKDYNLLAQEKKKKEEGNRVKAEKDKLKNAKHRNWGLYRNNICDVGRSFSGEARYLTNTLKLAENSKYKEYIHKFHMQALPLYLQVCYLDLNEPENTSGLNTPDFKPSKYTSLAPGIIDFIVSTMKVVNIDIVDVEGVYYKCVRELQSAKELRKVKLPVSANGAWKKIGRAIKTQIK